jgi:hypothetical protein
LRRLLKQIQQNNSAGFGGGRRMYQSLFRGCDDPGSSTSALGNLHRVRDRRHTLHELGFIFNSSLD